MVWNSIAKSEKTGSVSPMGHSEFRVTLACGASACEWSEADAKDAAEMAWHTESQKKNPFVARLGAPVHIELAGDLTNAEILERVPDAVLAGS